MTNFHRHHLVYLAFCLFSLVCSPSSPPYVEPGLDQTQPTASSVSEPALRATLPASWDENWYSSPAVFDLDKDGKNEIIASRHSVLYVWKSNDSLLWRAPLGENASSAGDHGSSRMYCSPVVGDLNGDGYGEIAVCYANQAAVYDHLGNLMPGWPKTFPGSNAASDEIRSIAAADLNGDGVDEIIVVKTFNGPVTMVWSIDGSALSGWPQIADRTDPQKNDYGGYNQNIGVADVNGDGKKEIVCTYDICHIGIFYPDGTSFPSNAMFSGKYACSVPLFHDTVLAKQGWGPDGSDRDELTDSPPVFADLDEDGVTDIVLFSDHERAGEYVNRGNSLWALRPDMTRISGFESPKTTGMPLFTGYQDNIVQVAPAPCVSNLGTALPHIIVPSYDGWMRCYSSSGIEQWKVQFDASGSPFIGASEAAAGDLDNDGIPEIVFTTYSVEKVRSFLFVLNSAGQLLHKVQISGRGSMSAPTLADIDGDGTIEIVISLKDALGQGKGGVQIWDVPSAKKNNLDWPTGRGNYLRTGKGP